MTDPAFVEHVLASAPWRTAAAWGTPRAGHPEGTIGRHVCEQVLPFVERHFRALPDHWSLVALAYLHDIGKPLVTYREGRLHGDSHSVISARIAAELGAPDRLVQVILRNDRAYSWWRKVVGRDDRLDPTRWTEARRAAFVLEFAPSEVDLPLLVRFHRADNAYRRVAVCSETTDPVRWFEQRLVDEGLLAELPPEGQDQRLEWSPQG